MTDHRDRVWLMALPHHCGHDHWASCVMLRGMKPVPECRVSGGITKCALASASTLGQALELFATHECAEVAHGVRLYSDFDRLLRCVPARHYRLCSFLSPVWITIVLHSSIQLCMLIM